MGKMYSLEKTQPGAGPIKGRPGTSFPHASADHAGSDSLPTDMDQLQRMVHKLLADQVQLGAALAEASQTIAQQRQTIQKLSHPPRGVHRTDTHRPISPRRPAGPACGPSCQETATSGRPLRERVRDGMMAP